MHTTLPSHARVDVDPPELVDNLVGLIQGLHASMTYVLADELPDELALDELLAISAVAFKNYVYEPAYNQLENPRPYSPLGEFVCNYGPFESISYYSGWDVKEFNAIATKDFWKLLQFEIASGRPVTTIGAGAPFEIAIDASIDATSSSPNPVLVVGYHYEPRNQTLEVVRPGSTDVQTVDVTGVKDFQQAEPSFDNWMAIARPSESPEWTSSQTRQKLRVLRWVVAHARRDKEFSQEMRENYAPGFKAFESFLGIIGRVIDGELERDDALMRYITAHVDGLVRARQAASGKLPEWSASFLSDTRFEIDDPEEIQEALWAASAQYGHVADVLAGWEASEGLEALRTCYQEAFEAEKRAVEGLEVAMDGMPGGF